MGEKVLLNVFFTVHEGASEIFQSIAQEMTEAANNEPGTLGYEWFADAEGRQYRLVETYIDAAAVEEHFSGPAVQAGVPKLLGCCVVDRFEIYGDPGPTVTEVAKGMGASFFGHRLGVAW